MSITTAVQVLSKALLAGEKKVVTAESCTGGGLAFWLTSLPGSSKWFERSFVSYSNAAKEEMLGVDPLTLEKYGAVSEETAREMAEGALEQSAAQVSVAITGIAGPSGGSAEKPVGSVCFAFKLSGQETQVKKQLFSGTREEIRERSILFALEELAKLLAV